jgi:predicted secreted protein
MTAIVGNAGAIKINGAVVAEVRSYSIEMTADTIEHTTMGDGSGRKYVKGLNTFSGTADVYWAAEHFTGTVNADGEIQAAVGDAGTSIIVYPQGDVGSTDPIWSGDIIVTGYSVSASFDGLIEASISFQGTGPLTYATNG